MSDTLVLDCTLRDGGYINDWAFSDSFAEALYRAASLAGIDFIEVGFFDSDARGRWQNVTAETIRGLKESHPGGAKIALIVNYSEEEPIPPPQEEYGADLLRVVVPKANRAAAVSYAASLGKLGYMVSVNFMGISDYANEEVLDLASLIRAHEEEVDFFYVADSYGSLLPSRTREIFSVLRFGTNAKLGFHPHNNLQLAFANSLEAIKAGAAIVDGSMFGMGRGGGNLHTEAWVAYQETLASDRYDVLPLLSFCDLFMEPLRADWTWGYSLPQLMSGLLSCHPNYPTRLLETKNYTADDVSLILRSMRPERKARFAWDALDEAVRHFLIQKAAETMSFVTDPVLELRARAQRRALLVLGGPSIREHEDALNRWATVENLAVFSVNNPFAPLQVDGYFFGNPRRLLQYHEQLPEGSNVVIGPDVVAAARSILPDGGWTQVSLESLVDSGPFFSSIMPLNSGIEAVVGLLELGFEEVFLAGMDGFDATKSSYFYDEAEVLSEEAQRRQNETISHELMALGAYVQRHGGAFSLITPTQFEAYYSPRLESLPV